MSSLSVPAPRSEQGIAALAPLPPRAQVVVVGAGVIGSSVAYHLTRLGCRDVLLLERKSIGSGTTWHSHGVVGLVRSSQTLLRMAMETVRMVPELERLTGKSTGYSARGSVNVTGDPSRMIQFRRFADIARAEGVTVDMIDVAESERLWPGLNPDGLIGAMHVPTEGQCNPLDLTQALVAGARQGGARVVERMAVTGADIDNGRVAAVETPVGRVECEFLINCTGLWGRDFLRAETGGLPLQGVEHNYLVTDFSDDIEEGLPILRDPDAVMTVREDSRQLSFGFNESVAKLFAENCVPETFEFDQLPPDWDAAAPYVEAVAHRVPVLNEVGIRLFLCGPEAATPDTRYLLGPVPGLANYFVAAGFTGIGIGSAGGAGLAIAHWVLEGRPRDDLWGVDVQRMMPYQANRTYLMRRTVESNGKLFPIAWPHRQNMTARGVRRSPLHDAMKHAGACFCEVGGWEVPEWFASPGDEPAPQYSFEQPGWFPLARVEAEAAMTGCALVDRSMAGKYLITGADAGAALSGLATRDPRQARNGATRLLFLNARGGIEACFALIRQDHDAFVLLGQAALQTRDLNFLRQRLGTGGEVSVIDMTSGFAVIDILGPRATEVLTGAGWRHDAAGTPPDFDREAEIGYARATVLRETRLAVPGWSVVVPTEFAAGVFEALMDAGASHGLRPIGRHACRSLLTSAGWPFWSEGIGPRHSPMEAGLGDLVDLSDNKDFPGRAVCAQQIADGVSHRLARVVPQDPGTVLLGHEPIRIDGELVGAVDQAAYALATERAVGLAYLSVGLPIAADQPFSGMCEITVDGRIEAATYEGCGAEARRPSSSDRFGALASTAG